MIIDCHTHIGRNEHINKTVDELLCSMDDAGIDKSLVFAGELNDAPNDWVLEELKGHKDRLYMVGAAHPMSPNHKAMSDKQNEAVKLARWYKEGKIVAVKFYTGYDHYYPWQMHDNDDYLMELEDVGCPVIFHCGDCLNSVKCAKLKYSHPLNIDDVAVDYDKMNFIIAHMGYPWYRDSAEVCYKNANVYSDISGFVYGTFSLLEDQRFRKVLSEFNEIAGDDCKKLLFGSDWPISNQKSYVKAIESNGEISMTTLTENAKIVYKLP